MAKTWGELSQLPEFQSLSREEQERARGLFFDSKIAPQVAPEALSKARSMYDEKTLNRTWGEALSDTGKQIVEGGINIANAIPSLIAPGSDAVQSMDEWATDWREAQSPTMKAKSANAEAAVKKAGEEGFWAQTGEALSQYGTDPALASRLVATNIASLIPGLGSAKAAQVASLARSAKAAQAAGVALNTTEAAQRAAKMAMIAGGTTNAALNAGGARGEAYKDIYQTLVDQGYDDAQAEQIALGQSALPAAVGGITGAISGSTGLERALLGPALRSGGLKAFAAGTGKELGTEMLEEGAPKVATNLQAGEYDQRPWSQDLGDTLVQTAIGAGPTSLASGAASAMRAPAGDPAVVPPTADPGTAPTEQPAPLAPDTGAPLDTELPAANFASLAPELRVQALQNVAAGKPWDAGLGITDAEIVPPTPQATPQAPEVTPQAPPIPVVGPLSAAANAGQQASAAGISSTPAPTAEQQAAQQQAQVKQQQAQVKQETAAAKDQAALQSAQLKLQQQQQEAAAKQAQQQQDAALKQQQAALKLKQEQLKINQSEQKLGMGPTQFDEPALLGQANDLAALSQPTIDQPTPENADGLQAQTDAQVPSQVPGQAPNAAPVPTPAGEVALATTQAPAAATGQASAPGVDPATGAPLATTQAPMGAPGQTAAAGAIAPDGTPLATPQAPAAATGQTPAPAPGVTFPGEAPLATTQAPATATGTAAPLSNAPAAHPEQAHVDTFNRTNAEFNAKSRGGTPRPRVRIATEADLSPAVRASRRLVGAIATGFRHRIVYLAAENPKERLTFDGSVSPDDPTVIFLAADAANPVTRVFVHEVVHGIKQVAPEVYDNLVGSLRQLYDPQKVVDHTEERGYRGGLTEANEEEWVADFVSNTFHTPKGLAQIALAMDLKKTGAGLEFLNNLKEFIGRIIARLRGDPVIGQGFAGADEAVKDLEQAQAAVVKAIAEYARARLTGKTAESLAAAPLSVRKPAAPKPAKGAVAGANKDIQRGITSSASYKPGRTYGTVGYPQGGGNLTRLHERMLKITNSEDFKRLLDSLGLQSVGEQRTIRGMWLGEPEWTQSLKLKQTNGQPATFEQTRLVANLLGWAAQQDAGLTSMVVAEPVDGAFNIPSLYFGKDDGSPLTAAETDTALLKFAKVASGATVTPDGKAIKFLFFADEKSPKSEEDQFTDFHVALSKIATSEGLGATPRIAYTLSALDEFNKRTNDDEPGNYQARIRKLGSSVAQGFNAGNLSTGIIGRTVDSVLVPYIVNVRAEGFTFDFQRWGRRERVSPANVAALQRKVEDYEKANKHGLRPRLRTTLDISQMPSVGVEPRLGQATTVANAESQLAELDALKRDFPQAADTVPGWLEMEANAFASHDVPLAPARLIGLMQNQGEGLHEQVSRLTPGQRHDADAGFANGAKFLEAYTSGRATQATTGKLLLWSFLSKGVSPYVQEAMFIDAVRGIDPFIEQAAAGQFGPAELDAYLRWADGVARANGQGSPGNSTKHNLNAFGSDFLVKMAERPYEEVTVKDEKGKDTKVWRPKTSGPTKLEFLHNLIKDPTKSGRDIRREFVKIGSGVGIDNKVVSFTLLVTGRPDVLVLDRIQMRNLFNDGSFDNYNLYDGTKVTKLTTGPKGAKEVHQTLEQTEEETDESYKERVEEATVELAAALKIPKSRIEKSRAVATGSGLATFTTGVRGQMLYEFLEDKLSQVLPDVYGRLGRPQDASPGRYHWESWVVESGQEASHGTLDALLADINGEPEAFADVPVKQGEYGNTDYGVRYARDKAGKPYYLYDDSTGSTFRMLPTQWRAFLGEVNRFKARIPGFRVSTNQDKSNRTAPWYLDPRIDRSKLDEIIHKHGSATKSAAPLSRRPDAARDERAGAGPGAQDRPSYGRARPGAVKGVGVHYSRAEREALDSTRYGSGIKGQEAARVAAAADPRLKQRIYFYVSDGKGVTPEPGLGSHTHTVNLNNLYDLDADPRSLSSDVGTKHDQMNAFESAVLDAGFDGYVADFAGQRAAVLLGAHQVPVRYEGLGQRIDVPAGERATPNPIKQVAALLRTPWMRQTPKAFGDRLQALDPDLYRQFADQLTATDKTYWPGDMVKQLVPAQGPKFSLRSLPPTLVVDGVERPTTNSLGQPLHATEDGVRNFWRWFGDSRVVDADGRPRVVYHGTGTRFNKVNLKKGAQGLFWFTSDKAKIEAGEVGAAGKGVVMALYAKIDKPADWKQYDRLGLYEYPAKGLDGALLPETNGEVDGFVIDRPTQIKSANTNRGTFDPDNADIRFSNRPTPEPPPAETRFRKAQRVVQDKFNRFRVIQDWLKTQGVQLSEAGDVYRAEERFHARVANQIEDFREQTLKPLVAKSQKAGFKMADIAQFLHAQHAEERNVAIAKINPKFPDGGSGMTTAEARTILAAASPELKQIANEWRKISDASLAMKEAAGLITPEQAAAFRAKYAHYVPLRGGPEEQLMVGTGKGLKVRHKEQRALGHPVREGGEWIIEQLLADREASIMKAEKALIAKHVLQMAVEMQRPDIISVEQPKQRQVLKDKVSYVVTYKGSPIEAFQSLEAARVFRQMAGTQKGNHLIDFDIVRSSDPQVVLMASPRLGDNELMAYVAGHEIRIQINDDLLSRAYGNLGQDALGPILRAGRVLNTWLSKVYTGYNPEFILVNLMRDFTTGIANLSGEQGAMMAMRAVKRYPKAFRDLLRYARNPARATQSIKDYREDGGNTGAAYLDDLERIGTDVAAEYAKLQGVIGNLRERNARGAASSAIGNTIKPLVSWIEKLNQAGENAMRLAIYQAMRDSGKGRVAAASAAKNTTVNFNRKGELGLALNAWWLFFNAAVQGTSSIAHAHFKGATKGQAWAFSAGLAGTAYLAALLAAGDDEEDDEYEKISEYDRSRNLIIRTENGFAKIPVPYGYGFFANLGRGLADAQRTGELGKLPWHLASGFIEEFTPFGALVAGKQPDWQQAVTFMGPTAWQIGAVPAYNRTSFGTPLYPEQSFKTEEFARDQMWRGTKGTWADELAGALEAVGMDVSPETLKHLWRTGTGGAGTFVTGVADAVLLKARGAEDLDAREIPLLRKFVSVPGVQEARARYYEAVEEAKVAKETFARYKKQGRFEEMETYQGENEALISMAKVAEATAKRIKKARDLYDSVKLDPDLGVAEKRRQLREMEREETQIYDEYVRMFQERTRVAPR